MTIENTCQLRSKTENRTEIYPKQETCKETDPSNKHQKIAHLLTLVSTLGQDWFLCYIVVGHGIQTCPERRITTNKCIDKTYMTALL